MSVWYGTEIRRIVRSDGGPYIHSRTCLIFTSTVGQTTEPEVHPPRSTTSSSSHFHPNPCNSSVPQSHWNRVAKTMLHPPNVWAYSLVTYTSATCPATLLLDNNASTDLALGSMN